MPFITVLELIETAREGWWKLGRPLVYRGAKQTFVVPKGFETDLASVPRWAWSIIAPFGKHQRAAVLHDWLYRRQPVPREDADGIFRRVMREEGVGWLRRRTMWLAVRIGGGDVWEEYRKKREGLALRR